jgi:isopentenyl diphosphate isomerase/L-lactate dehydrogenase-like FMN-dependent dehydrogenase
LRISSIGTSAVAGGDGVSAVLDILANEIRRTLTLMGVAAVADLSRDHLISSG